MMPFPFQRRSKTDRTGVPLDGRPRSAKRTSGTTQTGRSLPSLSVDFEQTLQLRYQVFYLVFAKIERVAMRPNRYDADCRSIAPNLQPVLPDRLARCRCHCFCRASQFWLIRQDRSSTLSSINRCAFGEHTLAPISRRIADPLSICIGFEPRKLRQVYLVAKKSQQFRQVVHRGPAPYRSELVARFTTHAAKRPPEFRNPRFSDLCAPLRNFVAGAGFTAFRWLE